MFRVLRCSEGKYWLIELCRQIGLPDFTAIQDLSPLALPCQPQPDFSRFRKAQNGGKRHFVTLVVASLSQTLRFPTLFATAGSDDACF